MINHIDPCRRQHDYSLRFLTFEYEKINRVVNHLIQVYSHIAKTTYDKDYLKYRKIINWQDWQLSIRVICICECGYLDKLSMLYGAQETILKVKERKL